MKNKIIISLILLVFTGTFAFAQGGSLAFLELNPDARNGAMGDVTMGESTGMYIYTNPTSFLQDSLSRVYGSYTLGIFPKVGGERLMYHAVSAGYKRGNQALLVGFRYLGGAKIPRVSLAGTRGKDINPFDYSVDLTYARTLTDHWSAYATGTFIQSYIGKTTFTGSFSGGVYYRNAFDLDKRKVRYTVGLSIADLGAPAKYGKNKYDQPASIGLGSSFATDLSVKHSLNLAWTTRYFVLPSEGTKFVGGLGAEYQYMKKLNLRAGYHIENNNSYATIGAGFSVQKFNFDVAYRLSTVEENSKSLLLGCSMRF